MRSEKCDCNICSIRKIFDKVFTPEIKNEWHGFSFGGGRDEEYEYHHMCGLCEHIERCDIPGFRSSDKWFDNENCILKFLTKNKDNEQLLPTYKGTYEDLLKID